MEIISYGIVSILSTIFFSALGEASAKKDRKKQKILYVNGIIFIMGFITGMLFLL